MVKNIKPALVFLAFSILSCKSDKGKTDYNDDEIARASTELNAYFDTEFEKDVEESPMMQTQLGRKTNYGKWDNFSHLKYAEDLAKAKARNKYLKENVDENSLDKETRLSYRLYKQDLDNQIEDYDYRFYDYPVNQMRGYNTDIPAFLINMHRIDSIQDARAYIERLHGVPKVFEDAIEGMKIREQNGILPPKFVFEKSLESSRNVIKGKPFENSIESSALLEDFKMKV